MKLAACLAACLGSGALALAGAAHAQIQGPQTSGPPMAPTTPSTPHAASPAMSPAAAGAPTGYGLDTPIETIAADPAGKAVLEKDMPGLLEHPMYENFKAMSLQDVAPLSNGQITDAALARAKADLAVLKPAK